MNSIIFDNIILVIKDIKEQRKNISKETIDFVNKMFFSYNGKETDSDIVLVLGGLQEKRAIVGSKLCLNNNIPIIFSGGVYHNCFNMTESCYYKSVAIENGVNDNLIYIENSSTNTYENFLYSLELIKNIIKKDKINVYVVSSSMSV